MIAPDHMLKAVRNLLANQGTSTYVSSSLLGGVDEPEISPLSTATICPITVDATLALKHETGRMFIVDFPASRVFNCMAMEFLGRSGYDLRRGRCRVPAFFGTGGCICVGLQL